MSSLLLLDTRFRSSPRNVFLSRNEEKLEHKLTNLNTSVNWADSDVGPTDSWETGEPALATRTTPSLLPESQRGENI